ncbi:MFS transporter [Alkalispirochaeta sphaeroplastigenens]|uniref:MFS transporter n=1 Tax=Alkalispirochaeta sphaeroplastigenens TaxID=1187066 RepID=A0A2S4JJC0_9SPIO|nr:OFA family MFS transporter [Alkalispirochaeta sphaeroplastigenens]POQ99642.1 MFS transporter [Alkalispirochaeta sphaeroplastigenens]
MKQNNTNRGWAVVASGLGINLALGVLYAWSIFKEAITESIHQGGPGAFQWNPASLNDPYALCTLVFAFAMIAAGRLQDKKGPALTAFLGGLLVASGFFLISRTTSYALWVFGFGGLVGAGIGFGYSASTPPALKWFPRERSGLIAGIVVSGFGLAPLYIAPLANFLLGQLSLSRVLALFGGAFLLIVSVLSLFLKNPPAGFSPEAEAPQDDQRGASPMVAATGGACGDVPARQMLRSPAFHLLWLLYFVGAGAGLMVIGSIAGLAQRSLGDMAFLAVAIMAVGNAAGRVAAGILSDRLGKNRTLGLVFLVQALLMFAAVVVTGGDSALLLVLVATSIGFNYGANLSLFPAFSKAWWGMKNFGVNYGLLFTAWGTGGFIMSRLSQTLAERTGSFALTFVIAGTLLLCSAGATLLLNRWDPAPVKVSG